MHWFPLLPFAAAIANIWLALDIFFRFKQQLDESRASFIYIAIFNCIWSLTTFLNFSAADSSWVLKLSFISAIGAGLVTIWMFYYAVSLAELKVFKKNPSLLLILMSYFAITSELSIATDLVNVGVQREYWGWYLVRGPLYPTHTVMITILSLSSLVAAATVYFNPELKHKRGQATVFITAFLIPIANGIAFELVAPMISFTFPPLTPILTTITVVIIGISMSRGSFLGLNKHKVANRAVDTMSDLLISVDINYRILNVNQSTLNVLRYNNVRDLYGVDFRDFIKDLDLDDANKNKKNEELHFLISDLKGNDYPVSGSLSETYDSEGALVGYIILLRPLQETVTLVSAMAETQKNLIKKNEEMERLNQLFAGREKRLHQLEEKLSNLGDKTDNSALAP